MRMTRHITSATCNIIHKTRIGKHISATSISITLLGSKAEAPNERFPAPLCHNTEKSDSSLAPHQFHSELTNQKLEQCDHTLTSIYAIIGILEYG